MAVGCDKRAIKATGIALYVGAQNEAAGDNGTRYKVANKMYKASFVAFAF